MTTSEQETPNPQSTIARVAVTVDPELVQTVVDFVRRVTEQAGLGAEAAGRLGQTLGEVCRNIIEYAFSPGEARLYDVEILRLQYLNEGDIRPEDVRTASDFGQELFDFVFEGMRSADRRRG